MITRKHMVRFADEFFRLHWDECEAAARKGMDTPLDVTINEHRMEMLRKSVRIVAQFGLKPARTKLDVLGQLTELLDRV